MDILVAYDVNTETKAGQKRLYRVAQTCKKYGQRVQYSVFECTVSDVLLEKMRAELLKIIDKEVDSLRIYRLHGARESYVQVFGVDGYRDFREPLIV